jgi:very-short-patch-repair endonuclease
MEKFTKDLDDLVPYFKCQKTNLTTNLEKNYKENLHFIKRKTTTTCKQNGGQNKIQYLLTESAFDLLKNSYNLRNRYIVDISDTAKSINIGMCVENQTIGFIENAFKGVIDCKRQFTIGKYRIDLYFPDYRLAVECDENNHIDRDPILEKIREDYIISRGNKLIRFNPNAKQFDLSDVIREIFIIILK